MVNEFSTKQEGVSNAKKTVSSTNGVKKTGQPYAKEINWTTFLCYTQKQIQDGLKT